MARTYERHIRIRYHGAPEALPGIVQGLADTLKPTARIRIGYAAQQEIKKLQQQQLPSLPNYSRNYVDESV